MMPEYNILLVCPYTESMEEEISFLEERNFSVSCTDNGTEALFMLSNREKQYHAILVGPVTSDPSISLETAEVLLSETSVPLLFYCEQCSEEILDKLDSLIHQGIIPQKGGKALLKSELNRVIGLNAGDPQTGLDPITRLIGIMKESNRESGKSDYGYIISGLTDAVIIDRFDDDLTVANLKACEMLDLPLEEISTGGIYKKGWEFVHEDLTGFPPEKHPHLIARQTGEPVRNVIMGINRPGKETLWISVSSLPVFKNDDKTMSGVITTFYNISELVNIRNYNLKLAAIFQYSGWGIVIGDDKGNIINVNPAFSQSHGFTIRELENKPIKYVFPRDKWDEVAYHTKQSLNHAHYQFESVHLRKDGSTFPVVIDITTIRDTRGKTRYRAAFVTDITERKKQEAVLKDSLREKDRLLDELRLEKEFSDTLFYNSPIAIYAVDKNYKVVNFNQKAEEITGYKKEELIGREFNMYADDLSDQRNDIVGKEFSIYTKEGQKKVIEKYSSLLYNEKGDVTGDIESFIDITDWKELQGYKSDMERIIRHDLKTPLNSIIGFPKLMLTDESLSEEHREYLMIILMAGQNMLNLINASLNMYKLEKGTYEFTLERINVISVLQQVRNILRENCHKKNNSIELLINGNPPDRHHSLEIITESSLFSMIFINLVKNALEASPHNGKVTVSVREEEHIEISVHNMGVIPEQIRSRFFEKNVTFGKKHGNGLGTYSAKLMASAIKAELTFTTSEEEGTTLFLRL